jgi:hypothetical protein
MNKVEKPVGIDKFELFRYKFKIDSLKMRDEYNAEISSHIGNFRYLRIRPRPDGNIFRSLKDTHHARLRAILRDQTDIESDDDNTLTVDELINNLEFVKLCYEINILNKAFRAKTHVKRPLPKEELKYYPTLHFPLTGDWEPQYVNEQEFGEAEPDADTYLEFFGDIETQDFIDEVIKKYENKG